MVNHAIHCEKSEQSLLAEDQLEFSDVEVYSRAKVFNGRQCILAKHPETGKQFHIDLGWDGSTKFINTRTSSKADLKTLPRIILTNERPL